MTISQNELTTDWLLSQGYVYAKKLADGRLAGVAQMYGNRGRICLDCHELGFERGYCYNSLAEAIIALAVFESTTEADEPNGWVKATHDGRRRPDGTKASERARDE